MRYVRLVHAFHVLDGSCSHVNLINAMETLLAGWVAVDEGDRLSEYSTRLRAECQCKPAHTSTQQGHTGTGTQAHTPKFKKSIFLRTGTRPPIRGQREIQ